jgi:hypothetical protein
MSKALRHMDPVTRDLTVKRRLKNMAGGAGTCAAMDYKVIQDSERKAKEKKTEEGLQNPVEVANEDVQHGITGVQLLMAKIDKGCDPLSPAHNPAYAVPGEPIKAQGAGMDAGKDEKDIIRKEVLETMTLDEMEFVDEHIVGGA